MVKKKYFLLKVPIKCIIHKIYKILIKKISNKFGTIQKYPIFALPTKEGNGRIGSSVGRAIHF